MTAGAVQGSVLTDRFGVLRSVAGSGTSYYGVWIPYSPDDEETVSMRSSIGLNFVQGRPKGFPGPKAKYCLPPCLEMCRRMHIFNDPEDCWDYCAGFCMNLRRLGCDWLFDACIKVKNKQLKEICMIIYNDLCSSIIR